MTVGSDGAWLSFGVDTRGLSLRRKISMSGTL